MANYHHLTFNERMIIQSMLNEKCNFVRIADALGKDPSTISKEVRSRSISIRKGGFHIAFNACSNRFTCSKSHVCIQCHSARRYKLCRRCSVCNDFCPSFVPESCSRLDKPPYVCNGCGLKSNCSLLKRFYYADTANAAYRSILSSARKGFSFSEDELLRLDSIISPLIRQGQSPHHICSTCRDSLMVSESTIYRLIDARAISAMNLDLPRKVRFRPRKKTSSSFKVEKSCRVGRDYSDFLDFMSLHPDISVTQLDSVEGKKGGKVLLTIHFTCCEFMLAFLRDHNDSRSVTDNINRLFDLLGPQAFSSIFKVCLTDNGSEFSNPSAIEFDSGGCRRTFLFYRNPNAPYQKGSLERNHEFIRRFIPKGSSLSQFSQEQINLMTDHINSYCRGSLGNRSPYETFAFMFGQEILDLLGCHLIPPDQVTLNRSIWHKGGDL